MDHDHPVAGNYTDDPEIESGGIMVTVDSEKATLSPLLARDISSSEFGASKRKSWMGRKSVRSTVLIAIFTSFVMSAIAFTAFMVMSPRTPSPEDAMTVSSKIALDDHSGVPEEFIANVLASVFGHEKDHPAPASNSSHRLGKRGIPADQGCAEHGHWLRRICRAADGPTAWEDECIDTEADFEYSFDGNCPPNTVCTEVIDDEGYDNIVCVPRSPPRTDVVAVDAKRQRISQYGYRVTSQVKGVGNSQKSISVTLQTVIRGASVTGLLMDDSRSYIIAPNNELNAHARGFSYALCHSDSPSKPDGRDCNPLFRYDFKSGNIVDYSFGLSQEQSVVFFYSITGKP